MQSSTFGPLQIKRSDGIQVHEIAKVQRYEDPDEGCKNFRWCSTEQPSLHATKNYQGLLALATDLGGAYLEIAFQVVAGNFVDHTASLTCVLWAI